jgi:chromosome segregation ATPase
MQEEQDALEYGEQVRDNRILDLQACLEEEQIRRTKLEEAINTPKEEEWQEAQQTISDQAARIGKLEDLCQERDEELRRAAKAYAILCKDFDTNKANYSALEKNYQKLQIKQDSLEDIRKILQSP